jgi:UrcA family protein
MLAAIRHLLFAVGLSLTLASIARAEPPAEKLEKVGQVPVSYADLDPQKEADARVLLTRLQQAAYTACGGNPRHHPSHELMPRKTERVFEECRRNAITRALGVIKSPTLSRLFAEAHPAAPPQ